MRLVVIHFLPPGCEAIVNLLANSFGFGASLLKLSFEFGNAVGYRKTVRQDAVTDEGEKVLDMMMIGLSIGEWMRVGG